jgi:hypothetical protein
MISSQKQTVELALNGLDRSNPLAFLATLGTLRTLTLAWSEGMRQDELSPAQWRLATSTAHLPNSGARGSGHRTSRTTPDPAGASGAGTRR